MKLRAVKGMNDILPEESRRYQQVENLFRETVEQCGFRELRTPIVEEVALFHKSTGETSEVVQKQMFMLQRERDKWALRPEGTPSSARVYLGQKMQAKEPVTKWYYIGPMFRAEQPQRGRYRQFHQAGCELYGDEGPLSDAEMIDMLYRMLCKLGVQGVEVHINTLGGPEARSRYREKLVEFFTPQLSSLSEHAQERLKDNPLRILDSKDPGDQAACQGAPELLDVLTDDDRSHFEGLKAGLDALGTPYKVDPRLVRGLDYYTRTCFELVASTGEIGSQNALLGGGRYDHMLEGLGGKSTPAIGFAMGLERILLALGEQEIVEPPLVFIAPMGTEAQLKGLTIAASLRAAGLHVELDGRGNSLKSMLRRANSMTARFAVVIGKTEVEKQEYQLKDLQERESTLLPESDLGAHIISQLSLPSEKVGA